MCRLCYGQLVGSSPVGSEKAPPGVFPRGAFLACPTGFSLCGQVAARFCSHMPALLRATCGVRRTNTAQVLTGRFRKSTAGSFPRGAFWPARQDSNLRPQESESCALSSCATGRYFGRRYCTISAAVCQGFGEIFSAWSLFFFFRKRDGVPAGKKRPALRR